MVIYVKQFPVIKYQCAKTTSGTDVLPFSNVVNDGENIPNLNPYSPQFDLSNFNSDSKFNSDMKIFSLISNVC